MQNKNNRLEEPKSESKYRAKIRGSMQHRLDKYRERSNANIERGLARTINLKDYKSEFLSKDEPETVGRVFMNGLLLDNPVLFNALGAVLIVGVCSTVQNAVLLSLLVLVLLIVNEFMASLFYKNAPPEIRLMAHVLTAALVLLPAGAVAINANATALNSFGIYLPLLCVSGLVTVRSEVFAIKHTLKLSMADALGNGAGFAWVAILIGAARELLSFGSVAGYPITGKVFGAGINYPFATFLMIGFLAALLKHLRRRHYQKNADAQTPSEEVQSDD